MARTAPKAHRIPQIPPLHHDIQHYPQAVLRWAREGAWMPKSQMLLSRHSQPADAILFVHGWGGKAAKTWEAFPQFASTIPAASKADILFLEYPSLQSQVPFCAAQLRRFLIDLVRDPVGCIIDASLPLSAPKRPKTIRYRRIFVIAHSMGAVVARRALMDLDQSQLNGFTDQELDKFHLLFFAPAHSGSEIPLLISSGLGLDFLPGAKAIASAMRIYYQSLRDLEVGSGFLEKLAADCQKLRDTRLKRQASIRHLRAAVYHAHNDRVVSQNDFDQDPPFQPVMNQNHRSICKPNETYREPLEALHALLAL